MLDAPTLFGEGSLEHRPHPSSAKAVTDCKVIAISESVLLGLMDRSPALRQPILALLTQRIRNSEKHVAVLVFSDAQQRVAVALLLFDELGLLSASTQDDMGSYIGDTRETVSLHIGPLKKHGVIAVEDRRTKLLERDTLQFMAEGDPLPIAKIKAATQRKKSSSDDVTF